MKRGCQHIADTPFGVSPMLLGELGFSGNAVKKGGGDKGVRQALVAPQENRARGETERNSATRLTPNKEDTDASIGHVDEKSRP